MAELTVITTIVTLTKLVGKAIIYCIEHGGPAEKRRDDIIRVKTKLVSFNADLMTFKLAVENNPDLGDALSHLCGEAGPVTKATAAMNELTALLGINTLVISQPPSQADTVPLNRPGSSLHTAAIAAQLAPPSKVRKFMTKATESSVVRQLKWPLDEARMQKILADLEDYQRAITLALEFKITEDVQLVLNSVRRVEKNTLNTLQAREVRQRMKWLYPNDTAMRTLHGEKRAQQESATCTWMTKEAAWSSWLQGPAAHHERGKFIWIHGIPGAGKTVLASYLIELAAKHCESKGCTYYYCHYSRDQDETKPFLKWIVRDLSRQAGYYLPKKLDDCYKSDREPSVEDLLECLQELSTTFHRTYVIVDAVDESRPRESLLKTLTTIGTDDRFRNVSLLFTSRKEQNIHEAVQAVKEHCEEISMANPEVRADIRWYIEAEMKKIVSWRKLSLDFHAEIRDTLVQGARGMFRWAACQVDILKRERDQAGIRRALQELPQDLFATYERILKDIPERHRDFARTTLALICSDTSDIQTAEIMVKACLYSCQASFNEIDTYTVDQLRQVCGCLVTLTRQRDTAESSFARPKERTTQLYKVSLAHYTVREFLFFPGTAEGPVKYFALSDEKVRSIDLKVIFNGLKQFGLRQSAEEKIRVTDYEEHCLRMTENALTHRKTEIVNNRELRRLVLTSLGPSSPHLAYLRGRDRNTHQVMKREYPSWYTLMTWERLPNGKETGILANLIQLDWLDMAKKYLAEDSEIKHMIPSEAARIWTQGFKLNKQADETLLSLCVRKGCQTFLNLFARSGANFFYEAEILFTAISVFYDHERGKNGAKTHKVLNMLLEAGANPNPKPACSSRPPSPEKGRTAVSRAGFAFTPLQLAVLNLEPDWVDTLLWENAEANGVGEPGGVIPKGYESNEAALRAIGQQTPLEICATASPSWSQNPADADLVDSNRLEIERLLKRYGAIEGKEMDETMDEEMDEEEEGPEIIDMTGISNDS